MTEFDFFHRLQLRAFLLRSTSGLGSIALARLLSGESSSAALANQSGNSLAPKPPMFEPRAKNVIFLLWPICRIMIRLSFRCCESPSVRDAEHGGRGSPTTYVANRGTCRASPC